jgi:hypothetical protein
LWWLPVVVVVVVVWKWLLLVFVKCWWCSGSGQFGHTFELVLFLLVQSDQFDNPWQ